MASSPAHNTYALSNIYLLVGHNNVIEGTFSSGDVFYKAFLSVHMILLACIGITVATNLLLQLYVRASGCAVGLKLQDADKMILMMHVLFLCFFAAQLYPWTLIAFKLLFEGSGITLLQSRHIIVLLALLSKTALYLVEGVFRSIVRPNSFLTVHHLLFGAFVIIAFGTRDVFALKVDVILDNFAIYELLLYAGLIARRLAAPLQLTQSLLVSGIILYGITRVLQAFLLIYLFAGSYSRMLHHDIAMWWILLAGCLALCLLQCYTFPIYYSIIKRTQQQHQQAGGGEKARKQQCMTAAGSAV